MLSYKVENNKVTDLKAAGSFVDLLGETSFKNCEYGEAYDRTDGKKGIYCHCPRSILHYGNGSIFTPVRENLDFCSYGKPREG